MDPDSIADSGGSFRVSADHLLVLTWNDVLTYIEKRNDVTYAERSFSWSCGGCGGCGSCGGSNRIGETSPVDGRQHESNG